MANYLLQADSGGNCCDCDSRASPCDNCCGCVNVTFHDVDTDCGCLVFGFSSVQFSDIGAFNDNPVLVSPAPFYLHCSTCARHVRTDPDMYRFRSWGNGICSGSPTLDHDNGIDVFLLLISGVYYLVAYGENQTIMFIGSTSDLSLPIVNESFCTPTGLVTWDDPGIRCIFGAAHVSLGAAESGTATVVSAAC